MKLVDYMISPLLLALGIGKIGSFFSGSEIGARTTFFLSVKYPGYDGLRHLTPFYEGVLLLLGSYITYKLLMSIRRNKHKESFAFAFFWWWIGLIFTAFDILKSDHDLIFGVSFDMIIAGMILLTSTLYLIYYFRAAITNKMAFIKR